MKCEDGVAVRCVLGEYETEATPVPFDIEALGLTCNAAGTFPVDPAHTACDGEDGCDGPSAFLCMDGERAAVHRGHGTATWSPPRLRRLMLRPHLWRYTRPQRRQLR